jgi:hypothetical protein
MEEKDCRVINTRGYRMNDEPLKSSLGGERKKAIFERFGASVFFGRKQKRENVQTLHKIKKLPPGTAETQIPPSTSPHGHFSNTSPKESLHYSNASLKGK